MLTQVGSVFPDQSAQSAQTELFFAEKASDLPTIRLASLLLSLEPKLFNTFSGEHDEPHIHFDHCIFAIATMTGCDVMFDTDAQW